MTRPPTAARNSLRLVKRASGAAAAPASDEDILRALESGDPAFGRLLYDRLVSVVEGTLYRMLGRFESEHDDLVQVAFEQIVITLAERRFAGACSLRSWAAAVTTRVALNALRSRVTDRKFFDRSLEAQSEADQRPGTLGPERLAAAREELQRMQVALSRLSPRLAQTLVLHDAFGHDLAEVAVLTDASVAAAQSRLVRGRKKLNALLESERRAEAS